MEINGILVQEREKNEVGFSRLLDTAKEFAENANAKNTKRGYRADLQEFLDWCEKDGVQGLPADSQTIRAYMAYMGTVGNKGNPKKPDPIGKPYKWSSIERKLAAISRAHEMYQKVWEEQHGKKCEWTNPVKDELVREVRKGMRRTLGTAFQQKDALLIEDLRRVLQALPENRIGIRDRALLLVAFTGCLRGSEVVALNMEDITFQRDGVRVVIRQSKTDQDKQGDIIGLPYGSNPLTCPVRALQDWIEEAQITEGALFRHVTRHGHVRERLTTKSFAKIVKRSVKRIGLDEERFSGHSLRSGFITTSARAGKQEALIMKQSRHKSLPVLRRYIREGKLFEDNPASGIGL